MFVAYDINSASARATRNATRFARALKTGKMDGELIKCEWADHNDCKCNGEIRLYPWYDLFSDKIQGVFGLCDNHDNYYGIPTEGFFECDDCNCVFPENSSWQLWMVHTDCGTICLNCARARALRDQDNWINLTGEIPAVDVNRNKRTIHGPCCPCAGHLYAVEHGKSHYLKDGLVEYSFVETLSSSEECVNEMIHKELVKVKEAGYTKAIIILSAAYQFSVTYSIMVPVGPTEAYRGFRITESGSRVRVHAAGDGNGYWKKFFCFKSDDDGSRIKAHIKARQWVDAQ